MELCGVRRFRNSRKINLILQTAVCQSTYLLQIVTDVFNMFQGAMWIT